MTPLNRPTSSSRLALAVKMLQSDRSREAEAGLQLLFDLLNSDPENAEIYRVIFRTSVDKPFLTKEIVRKLSLLAEQGDETAKRAIEFIQSSGEVEPVLDSAVGEGLVSLKFSTSTKHKLTPNFLLTTLAPYLNNIEDLQHFADDINLRERSDVRIRSITEHSPLTVSLQGVADAAQVIQKTLIPWRRKIDKELTFVALEQEKLQARILKETLKSHRLANQRAAMEMEKQKIELANYILDELKPGISGDERTVWLVRLLAMLSQLIEYDLKIDELN